MKGLRLGKNCKFKDIEVGEVFCALGCLGILYKESKKRAILLACDINDYGYPENLGEVFSSISGELNRNPIDVAELGNTNYCKAEFDEKYAYYKLPKDVQRLWMCDGK